MLGSKKISKNNQWLKDVLFQVKDLDYREQPAVYESIIKELDDSGVSAEELRRVIQDLTEQGEISEIDKKNLLALI